MIRDPRDRTGYGIAIASLGLAMAVLLAGICWIATQDSDKATTRFHVHKCAPKKLSSHCGLNGRAHTNPQAATIPGGLWVSLGALAGVLVGALIPAPPLWLPRAREDEIRGPPKWMLPVLVGVLATVAAGLAAIGLGDSIALYAIAAALAGLLLGLLIPSPGDEY